MRHLGILLLGLFLVGPLQAFDHSHPEWNETLHNFNKGGFIDYKSLKANADKFNAYLSTLNSVPENNLPLWMDSQKLAFWINAYNAFTLKAIIDHYPIKSSFFASIRHPKNSIRQIGGVWDKLTYKALGKKYTLDQIEHEIIREQFKEPRIHFALVCAAKGCPRLRSDAYLPGKLDEQLQNDAHNFFKRDDAFRIDRENNVVYLSSIFEWFGDDFIPQYKTDKFSGHSDKERAVLNFATTVIPDDDTAYLKSNSFSIKYIEYDWTLNDITERGSDSE